MVWNKTENRSDDTQTMWAWTKLSEYYNSEFVEVRLNASQIGDPIYISSTNYTTGIIENYVNKLDQADVCTQGATQKVKLSDVLDYVWYVLQYKGEIRPFWDPSLPLYHVLEGKVSQGVYLRYYYDEQSLHIKAATVEGPDYFIIS